MPTFNQLVKQGRKSVAKKSNSPALQYTYNSLKKKSTESASPQKLWHEHRCDHGICGQ